MQKKKKKNSSDFSLVEFLFRCSELFSVKIFFGELNGEEYTCRLTVQFSGRRVDGSAKL